MLGARFLLLFLLSNVFLIFMLASLLLSDNLGRRPLGCALEDLMPDFLLETAVGCTLKCYYDQKITFIFSSDFETMFIKHSASEIISLNFEKKTVNLNCNFPF